MIYLYSHPAEEFMDRLKRGVHWGTGNRLLIRHVDWPFVVWTVPGGNVWSGMWGTSYHRAQTHVSDASKAPDTKVGMRLKELTVLKTWEGRFGKAQRKECLYLIMKETHRKELKRRKK